MTRFALIAAVLVIGGCTTPYPDAVDTFYTRGASLDANRAPRGSKAFCERYAQQSQDNFYESNSDPEDGFGRNGFVYNQARTAGNSAYERCLRGRTN
ncbi:hypothetical protein [Aureimonas psammosilenae]|uniref:hypothetical protein n=1 Tax=Aureimonas psammosilenae TaxID=2495496 RepID=UPI001260B65B|nr:hypothetical protein [Aureimonas psammosilenae]